MNSIDCGRFIAELRKEKRLTQNELAEKLQVTNKAISRWETGEGFPDVTMLPDLADIFDVSVDELLRGKRKSNRDLRPDKRLKLRFSNALLIIKGLLVLGYILFLALAYTTFKVWIGGIAFAVLALASFVWFFIERNRYIALSDYNEGDRLTLFMEERNIVSTTATLSAMTMVMIVLVGLLGMYANGVIAIFDYIVWGSVSGMGGFAASTAYYHYVGIRLGLEKPTNFRKTFGILYAFLLAIPLAGNLSVLSMGTILFYLPIALFAAFAIRVLAKETSNAQRLLALLYGAVLVLTVAFLARTEDFYYVVLTILFLVMMLLALWLMIRGWVIRKQSGAYALSVHYLSIGAFYMIMIGHTIGQIGEPIRWMNQAGLFLYYLVLPFTFLLIRKYEVRSLNKAETAMDAKESEGLES